MLFLSLPAFENKKYTASDRFHGNGPYGKIPTKKEPIRMLGFTLPYNKSTYLLQTKLQLGGGGGGRQEKVKKTKEEEKSPSDARQFSHVSVIALNLTKPALETKWQL